MICDFCQKKIEIAACPACRAENIFICDMETQIDYLKGELIAAQDRAAALQVRLELLEEALNDDQRSLSHRPGTT